MLCFTSWKLQKTIIFWSFQKKKDVTLAYYGTKNYCHKFRLSWAFQYLLLERTCKENSQYWGNEERNSSIAQYIFWNLVACSYFTQCSVWKIFFLCLLKLLIKFYRSLLTCWKHFSNNWKFVCQHFFSLTCIF